jgi:lipase chaperone LimK
MPARTSLLAGLGLLSLVGWLYLTFEAGRVVPQATTPIVRVSHEGPPARLELVPILPNPGAGPAAARSLRDTEVDGDFSLDADRRFVATRGARRLFDYFLTTEGEQDLATIRAQVQGVAQARLPGPEAERAVALFDRYLRYREAARAALAEVAPGDARAALAGVLRAQDELFGRADAERLFAVDNVLAGVTLERAALYARSDLSPEARDAQLRALEERLPERMRRARAERWRAPARFAQAPPVSLGGVVPTAAIP